MAGSPERPSNQPPTRIEENKNIGNYYLTKLLKNHRPTEHYDWGRFKDFNDLISSRAKVKIPPLLIDQLQLEEMRWQPIGNPPSALLIGRHPNEDESWLMTDIDQSNATIEIVSRTERIKLPGLISRDIPTPVLLRIAGVDKEQCRIIAATYNLEDQNRLTELNVSIPAAEPLEYEEDLDTRMYRIYPTEIVEPYKYAAGLITPAMYKTLNDALLNRFVNDIDNQFPHSRVLKFEFGKNNSNSVFERLGYYEERRAKVVTVGLSEKATERTSMNPWKISVPEFLIKV